MINLDFSTFSKQGLVGLGKAISHYLSLGLVISIPITDNQGYDLILDRKNQLLKIQVKTTKTKERSGFYKVSLRTISGRKIIGFDYKKFDLLYVLTAENISYEIPNNELKNYKNAIVLNSKWDKFKL